MHPCPICNEPCGCAVGDIDDCVHDCDRASPIGTLLINPPPNNGKCMRCGKFRLLRKTFRGVDVIYASWECEECLACGDEEEVNTEEG